VMIRSIIFCCSDSDFTLICILLGLFLTTYKPVVRGYLMQSQRDPRLNEILFPLFDHKRVKNIIDAYEVSNELRTAGLFSILWHEKWFH